MLYIITINEIQKDMQDRLIRDGYFKNRAHLSRVAIKRVMIRYTKEDNPLLQIKTSVE